MRTLLIGLLAAPLIGCSIPLSPLASTDSCTDANGYLAGAGRPAEPAPSKTGAAATKAKSTIAARAEERSTAAVRDAPHLAAKNTKPAVIEAKLQAPAAGRPAETSDPIIVKAKTTIAAKLEDPASAEFGEMKRAMRKNTLGKSVDTICGRVKGKRVSGEGAGDWPFLYLVTEDEAYVVNGPANSAAASAYRNICSEPGTTELSPAPVAKDRKVL
jgi:hypothetical protein